MKSIHYSKNCIKKLKINLWSIYFQFKYSKMFVGGVLRLFFFFLQKLDAKIVGPKKF